ncbi:MAG: flagellar biosynthesis anti-sigma factor FlgM [Thermodesulfobacteriota bacterium]
MKITGRNPLVDARLRRPGGRHGQKARPQRAVAAQSTAKVDVSGRARKLATLRKLVEASPEVREEKVKRIKKAIDEGKYNMKSARVAEGIIKNAINFYKASYRLD